MREIGVRKFDLLADGDNCLLFVERDTDLSAFDATCTRISGLRIVVESMVETSTWLLKRSRTSEGLLDKLNGVNPGRPVCVDRTSPGAQGGQNYFEVIEVSRSDLVVVLRMLAKALTGSKPRRPNALWRCEHRSRVCSRVAQIVGLALSRAGEGKPVLLPVISLKPRDQSVGNPTPEALAAARLRPVNAGYMAIPSIFEVPLSRLADGRLVRQLPFEAIRPSPRIRWLPYQLKTGCLHWVERMEGERVVRERNSRNQGKRCSCSSCTYAPEFIDSEEFDWSHGYSVGPDPSGLVAYYSGKRKGPRPEPFAEEAVEAPEVPRESPFQKWAERERGVPRSSSLAPEVRINLRRIWGLAPAVPPGLWKALSRRTKRAARKRSCLPRWVIWLVSCHSVTVDECTTKADLTRTYEYLTKRS
jgi:hypothetical protein